jgi:rhodanese-related sulfurtransferase
MEHTQSNEDIVVNFFKAKAAAYTSPMAVKAMIGSGKTDFVLVDVRIPGPQLTWRIPSAVAIPAPAMQQRFSELSKEKLIVLYCWDTWCSLATTAALVLLSHGYRVKELYGGVTAWQTLHLPQEAVTSDEVPSPVCAC